MKSSIQLFFVAAIAAIGFTSCEGTFYEGGPGQVNVITKGAGFRSEGGGLVDTVYFIGTHKVGNFWTKVDIKTVKTGPQMLWMNDLNVPIPALQNQSVQVDAGIVVMPNPMKAGLISSKMPNWQSKVYTNFAEVTKKVIQIDTKAFDAADASNAVLHRQTIGKKILEGTIKEFKINNPGFDETFFFITVVIGDITYPQHITDGYAKIASKQYELEYEKIKKSSEVLKEELEAQEMESDLEAYAREGGVMSPQLLKFKNMDNMIELLKNEHATVVIKINPDGSIDWFSK